MTVRQSFQIGGRLVVVMTLMIIVITAIIMNILILPSLPTNDCPPEFYNWGEVVVVVMTLMIVEF